MRRLGPAAPAALLLLQPMLLGISAAQPLEEFTLGFLNPWYQDYRLIAGMVLCDIEHRKAYEPDLVARFGPLIFPLVNTSAYRPTLRVRPVAAETGARQDVGVLAAMDFVSGVPGRYNPVDGLIGETLLSVLVPVGAIGAAYKVNHLTFVFAEDFSDKDQYPYFFRTSPPGSVAGRVMWSYFTFFGFKAAAFLYSSSDMVTAYWNVLLGMAAAAKRDKALSGVSVRDTQSRQSPVEEAEWTAAVARVKAMKVRLVFLCASLQMQATFGMYAATTLGLRAPAFQVVGASEITNQPVWYMELDTFHAIVPYFRFADPKLASFFIQYLSLNVTDIVDFMDRYGLNSFPDLPGLRFDASIIKQSMFQSLPTDNTGTGYMMATMFNAFNAYVWSFGTLLNLGYPRSAIRGELLRSQLQNWTLNGVGLDYAFNENQDSAYREYEVWWCAMVPPVTGPLLPKWTPLARFSTERAADGSFFYTFRSTAPAMWASGEMAITPPDSLLLCPPGQYHSRASADDLGVCVDCALGEFTNESEMSECLRCPAGTFGNPDRKGCTACAPGTLSPDRGAKACQNCMPGSAAGAAGSDRCAACPLGTYADLQSQTACSPCQREPPASGVELSTLFPGSTSAAACACPAGAYEPAASPGTCSPCPGGVECGFGTTLVAQRRRLTDSGGQGWTGPQAKPGYMLLPEDPLGAYLCSPAAYCPGGPPGTCSNDRLGPACGSCPDGNADAGVAECVPCTKGANALAAFYWVGIVVLALLVYYGGNGPITSRSTPLIGIAASVSTLLMTSQVVGIFKRISSPFPKSSGGVVDASAVLLFDWRTLIPLPCLFRNAWKSYVVNVAGFPLVCLAILGCWAVSALLVRAKLLPSRFPYLWEWDKALNSLGAFLQATFIIMASTAAIPMICYRHPNGKSSVAKLPAVICGNDDHQGMLTLGILLMFFAAAYYASILYLLATAPVRLKQLGPISFFRRMRFLVLLFNLERFYWAAVVSLRSLSLALVPVFIPNSSHGQQLLLAGILQAYAVAVVTMWPWKVPVLNVLDATSCAILVLVLMMSGVFIPAETEKPAGLEIAMTALMVLQYSTSFAVLVGCMVVACSRGRFALLSEPLLLRWRLDVDAASRNLLGAATDLLLRYGDDAVTLAHRVENWQYEDIRAVEKAVDVLLANGEVGASVKAGAPLGRLACEMDPVSLSALSSGHLGSRSRSVSADAMHFPVVVKKKVLSMAVQSV